MAELEFKLVGPWRGTSLVEVSAEQAAAVQNNEHMMIVLAVDISGSMQEEGRLSVVKHCLRFLHERLSSTNAELEIVVFNHIAQPLMLEAALGVAAHGGTNFEAALETCACFKPSHLILLTDGLPTRGEREPSQLRKMVPLGCSTMAVGVGAEARKGPLSQIIDHTVFVEPGFHSVASQLGSLVGRMLSEVATELTLSCEGAIMNRSGLGGNLGTVYQGERLVIVLQATAERGKQGQAVFKWRDQTNMPMVTSFFIDNTTEKPVSAEEELVIRAHLLRIQLGDAPVEEKEELLADPLLPLAERKFLERLYTAPAATLLRQQSFETPQRAEEEEEEEEKEEGGEEEGIPSLFGQPALSREISRQISQELPRELPHESQNITLTPLPLLRS